VFEVTDVARGEGCLARGGDAGDLNVADFDRSADYPLPSGYCGRAFCRGSIKRYHAAAQDLVNGAIEGVIEAVAPTAWRQKC
jgi:hypothetical protein